MQGGSQLDGRLLDICLAVDRSAAGALAQSKKDTKKPKKIDKRNLFLLREGS